MTPQRSKASPCGPWPPIIQKYEAVCTSTHRYTRTQHHEAATLVNCCAEQQARKEVNVDALKHTASERREREGIGRNPNTPPCFNIPVSDAGLKPLLDSDMIQTPTSLSTSPELPCCIGTPQSPDAALASRLHLQTQTERGNWFCPQPSDSHLTKAGRLNV